MSINDFREKIKPFYTLLLILVVASVFFALGRLSAINDRKLPIRIINQNKDNSATVINAVNELKNDTTIGQTEVSKSELSIVASESGAVVGSKSGKKYYYPWCGTVKRIKPENQVKFASIEEARQAGFLPGGNCKGLK